MKVLVPVDGSDVCVRALDHLLKKRADYREPDTFELHLLNVQRPLSSDVGSFVEHRNLQDFHRAEALAQMKPARDFLDRAGVPYTTHIAVGQPGEVIVRFARELACDQIVMGTHGHSALTHLLLGSVASDVVGASAIPVLLIK